MTLLSGALVGLVLQASQPEPRPVPPRIAQLSPLPPLPPDPTNAVADDARAARLGQRLFFDRRLSSDRRFACATCHDPAQGFADGRPLPAARSPVARHVPTLWNVAYQRWFFWDGRADSLWAQALDPIVNPAEMAGSRQGCFELVRDDPTLRAEYAALFGPLPADAAHGEDVDRLFVNVGKALAAYERQLVSRRAPFDIHVEGLREGDAGKQAALGPSARRGLDLFVGRGNCRLCHGGPTFSDGEFHDLRLPVVDAALPPDAGRYDGVSRLLDDPFNARSRFSDVRAGPAADKLIRLRRTSEQWGAWKTPTLRNVARTAPYMHDGRFATLRELLRWYSKLEGARPDGHHGGESILRPLDLTEAESDDLIAFLEALTDEAIAPELLRPLPD